MFVTIVISVLLHLVIFVDMWFSLEPLFQSEQTSPKTIDVVMLPPDQKEDKPPPPEHNEDDPTKANNQNGLAEQTRSKQPKAKQGIKQETIQKEDLNIQRKQQANKTNLNELDDSALEDVLVESPLDKNEEALRRWHNEVYKRLSAQVMEVWVKPDGTSDIYRGVIRLNIDLQGYLNRAWIHLPSGDRALDQSALMAVKSIIRYRLPASPSQARYYKNLEFRYSGD